MRKVFILLAAVVSSFTIISCQKEVEVTGLDLGTGNTGSTGGNTGNTGNTGSIGDITGVWKFINLHAKTIATNQVSAAGVNVKTVTTTEYTSQDNSGTITIEPANLAYNNLSYNIKAIAYATVYDNGVLADTFSFPFEAAVPPISNRAAYTRIGSDSLYFQAGSVFMNGVSQPTQPTGAKLRREQDKLFIIQRVNQTTTVTEQGQTTVANQQAEVTITLQKQ